MEFSHRSPLMSVDGAHTQGRLSVSSGGQRGGEPIPCANEISSAHLMPPTLGRESLVSHVLLFESRSCDTHAHEECRHAKQRDEV